MRTHLQTEMGNLSNSIFEWEALFLDVYVDTFSHVDAYLGLLSVCLSDVSAIFLLLLPPHSLDVLHN